MHKPTVFMMIGLPASGKSTLIKNHEKLCSLPVVSTDNILENIATVQGQTYDEVFSKNIKFATKLADEQVEIYVKNDMSFVWDQTNLTMKSRAKKLAKIPDHWERVAVWVKTPDPLTWQKRLESRPGKTIPAYIIKSMAESYEYPNLLMEGFDGQITNAHLEFVE